MKYHSNGSQRMAGFFTIAGLVLFVAYAVFMYLRNQSEVVRLAYFVASDMADFSSPESGTWVSSILGTVLCVIPALLLMMRFYFPVWCKAVMFLPSYVLLGFLTGIAPASVADHTNSIPLAAFLALLTVSAVAIIVCYRFGGNRDERTPFLYYVWTNVLISCLGMMMCISLTSSDRRLNRQLRLSKALYCGDYATVDRGMKGESRSDNTITAIQAMSLSCQGQLADRLFSLTGLEGSGSLVPDSTPPTLLYHTHCLLYRHLHAMPLGHFPSTADFLRKALDRRMGRLEGNGATKEDSFRTLPLIDYYLCSLLLDCDLNAFSAELPRYYGQDSILPRHYREALAMSMSGDSLYGEYLSLRQKFADNPAIQRKECARNFPNSYWNYYHEHKSKQ